MVILLKVQYQLETTIAINNVDIIPTNVFDVINDLHEELGGLELLIPSLPYP